MGCASPSQPVRQQLTVARLIQWLPELNLTEARVEWCVGQPPRGDAPLGNLIVNGVREDSFVEREREREWKGDEIML